MGRLELSKNGHFGGICDDKWDVRDAHVACIQLGFLSGVKSTRRVSAEYVPTSDSMWATRFYCKGLETNIFDCPFMWAKCSSKESVWVECEP